MTEERRGTSELDATTVCDIVDSPYTVSPTRPGVADAAPSVAIPGAPWTATQATPVVAPKANSSTVPLPDDLSSLLYPDGKQPASPQPSPVVAAPKLRRPPPAPAFRRQAAEVDPLLAWSKTPAPRQAAKTVTELRPSSTTAVELLWLAADEPFDALEGVTRWRDVIDNADDNPPDDEMKHALGLLCDDVELAHTIFMLLASGAPTRANNLPSHLTDALQGKREHAPRVVLDGSLDFAFDTTEKLKATLDLLAPAAAKEPRLREAMDGVEAFLKAPVLPEPLAAQLLQRLDQSFIGHDETRRTYLDRHRGRVLLEEGAYRRRQAFGGPHVLASFSDTSPGFGVPSYLPVSALDSLVVYSQMPVRLLCSLHPRQADADAHPIALRVRAVAFAHHLS